MSFKINIGNKETKTFLKNKFTASNMIFATSLLFLKIKIMLIKQNKQKVKSINFFFIKPSIFDIIY